MRTFKNISMYGLFAVCFFAIHINAMNVVMLPDSAINPLLRPEYDARNAFQFFVMAEGSVGEAKAYGFDGSTGVLQIYEPNQNALTMLQGFSGTSQESQLLTALNATDDGARGHFDVCADLQVNFAGAIAQRYFVHKTWSISAYVPFFVMSLEDVVWKDQTLHNTDADERVHVLLTDQFCDHVHELGCGLELGGWQRHGFGDIDVMVEWYEDFPQSKEFLRNVRLNGRVGIGLPTGLRRDVDKVLALPFGYDGAFSLPFGAGLDLTFVPGVWAGLDVFLVHAFGRSRVERIRTSLDQTSFLFLQKANAYRDFGLTQEFSIYVGTKDLPEGLSTRIGYQYNKRGRDNICLHSNVLSTEIANTAPYLRDWTAHQIIVRADYDFGAISPDDAAASPRLSLYARLPFNGSRSVLVNTIGMSLAVDF